MTMQGVDISSYQQGIDLESVPCDFAIVKATEGTGYVNPDCDRAVQQCIGLGKCWGVYHYVNGSGAKDEADFFIDQCSGYIRHGILCVDWESGGNSAWGDLDYLGAVVDRIIERTGVKPLIYASASVYDDVASVASARDCGLWIAQYENIDATGYQDEPWNEGAYDCVIRQYASTGQLDGWPGNLDLDKAYIDAGQWALYADPEGSDGSGDQEVRPDAWQVQLYTPNGTYAQRWAVEWDGAAFTLVCKADGRALDVTGGAIEEGTPIQAYTPNGTDAQKWKAVQATGDYVPSFAAPVEFVPVGDDSMRLDCIDGGTDDGTGLQLYRANGTPAQQWAILDHGDGTWTVVNVGSCKAIDVVGAGA